MAILTRNNRFIIDYYPNGGRGKRVRLKLPETVASVEEAKAIEADLKRAIRGEVEPEPATVTSTFGDLFEDYLRWVLLHRAKSTFREHEYSFKYISRIIGKFPVAGWNNNLISLYQKTRHGQGVSNRTINKELHYVSGFIRWCREEQNIAVQSITIKKLPHTRPIPIVLSPDEVVRIIDAAEPFYRAFFLCLYSLGLRFSEARNLTWGNIDFANKTILTRQKGGSYKVLPLNQWLEDSIIAIKPDDEEKIIPDAYIFLVKRTGRPIVNVKKAIARAVEKAKVTKKVNPHLFRHSIATHFMGENINLRKIQIYLGHADITTTAWYTHVVAGHLKDATEGMFQRMSKRPEP